MRPKSDIEALLNHLQILYDNPINSSHQHYYAKLALFELCGWLEGVFDELVQNHANSKLITLDCIQRYAEIIKKTHGCDYKKHLCPLLRNLIGIVNVEKIEIILRDTGDLAFIESQLDTLWTLRCHIAHSSTAGVTPSYNSPTNILIFLNRVYLPLQRLETELSII